MTAYSRSSTGFSPSSLPLPQNDPKSIPGRFMDRYTKLVLTIIAVALVWIGIKDIGIVENAMAATGIVEVKVVDIDF